MALSVVFCLAVIPHPPEIPIVRNDKLQHALAFAVLATLGWLGYPRFGIRRLAASLLAFAALIEVVQAIPPLHRASDIYDWYAGGVAVLAVLASAAVVRHFGRRRS